MRKGKNYINERKAFLLVHSDVTSKHFLIFNLVGISLVYHTICHTICFLVTFTNSFWGHNVALDPVQRLLGLF